MLNGIVVDACEYNEGLHSAAIHNLLSMIGTGRQVGQREGSISPSIHALILSSCCQKRYQGGNATEPGNGLVILGIGGEVTHHHGAVLLPDFVRSLMAQVRHDVLKRTGLIGNLQPVQGRHRRVGKGKDCESLDLLILRLE